MDSNNIMDELQKYDKPPHEKRPTACVPREATKKTVRSSTQLPSAGIQSGNRTKGRQKLVTHSAGEAEQ